MRRALLIPSVMYAVALTVAGVLGLHMEIPWGNYQLLDAKWLRSFPGVSLLYMHSQPPVLNGLLALTLWGADCTGLRPEVVAKALFLLLGWVAVVTTFVLGRKLTGSSSWGAAAVGCLLASPGIHVFQNVFFYPFLVQVLLVVLLWTAWNYFEGRSQSLFAVAVVLATICLTWVLYHPLWAFATFAWMVSARAMLATRVREKKTGPPGGSEAAGAPHSTLKTIGEVAVPAVLLAVLLVAWPLKNQVVFGRFIYTSWAGSNLANTTGIAENEAFVAFVRKRRVLPSLEEPIRRMASAFPEDARQVVLSTTKSDGSLNHNHLVVLITDEDMYRQALAFRLGHPRFAVSKFIGQYWAWTRATFVHPYTEELLGPNSPAYKAWARAVLWLFFVDLRATIERALPLQILHEQAFVRRRQLPYTLFGAVVFPLVMIAALVVWLRDLRSKDARGATMSVAWFAVLWSMLVPCATFGSEGNRMRIATAGAFLLLVTYVLHRVVEVLRPRHSPKDAYTSHRADSERDQEVLKREVALATGRWIPRRRETVFILALIGLASAAAAARSVGLDPETLWHDDVWIGALTRIDSLATAVGVPNAAPPGFVLVSWVMARLVDDSELALQAVPFAAGVLGILVAGWMGRALTGSIAAATALAALVVLNPVLVHYSVFVKQYTLEFLLVAGLVAVMAGESWPARPGWLAVFAVGGLSAASLGIGTAVVLAIGVNLVAVRAVLRAKRRGEQLGILVTIALAFNLVFALYVLTLVVPRAQHGLIAYWSGYYLPTSWLEARAFLGTHGKKALTGALPAGAGFLVWLAPVGLVALALRPRTRLVALLVVLTALAIMCLSALGRYPIGGGRTDVFGFPLTLACVIVGAHVLIMLLPSRRGLMVACAAALFVWAMLRAPGERYFELDQSRLARLLEVNLMPGDGLVIYPAANYLTAFYTRLPVAPRYGDDQPQWQMALTEPNGLTLPYGDPQQGRELLATFLQQHRYHRVLYFAARVSPEYPEEELLRTIEAAGFRERRRWSARIRTSLIVFERSE